MDSAQCCAVMFMLLGEPRILFRMVQIRMMEREKAIDPGDSKQQAAKSHLESGACREADNVDGCASTSDHISASRLARPYVHTRTHAPIIGRARHRWMRCRSPPVASHRLVAFVLSFFPAGRYLRTLGLGLEVRAHGPQIYSSCSNHCIHHLHDLLYCQKKST
jgi:hypothetical protein